MASGRRSGRQNILRSLLDEEEPPEKVLEKNNTVTSPPRTRNQTAQSQETTVGNKKLSPPNTGNQSPDPNCSICLGKLENKSFTDSCFHMFCFACLLEWSKVKPECPLCKQPFKSIIHNVRSYEDYDQYNIQDAPERVGYPWESPEGFRFRYRTTFTFDRLMEAHYEEQQRQLRLLQRPTLIQTRSQWRRRRQGATSEFRHRIYLNSMRVTRVTSRKKRQRKIGPAFYRANTACTHRLVPWLNRELNALLQNQSEHVHFLMELIMGLITRFDIESEESFEHLHSYLGRNTRHFLHEFASFARSPYDMVAYDQHAVYEPYTETVSDEEESFSSPGSDIIIVDDIITTSELPETRSRKKRAKFPLDPECHNPEHPSVIQVCPSHSKIHNEISTTSTSGWDSPTPGPSGLFASPFHTETVSTALATVDTSPSQKLAVKDEDQQASEREKQSGHGLQVTSDSDTDSNDSVIILKVEKPWFERTPITISSDSDEEIVVKTEDNDSRKKHQSKRKHEEGNTSGSRNSSSDTIDVTSVTSEPKQKKHKREHKKGKHKHKKSSKHSSKSDTKSSDHSKKCEKRDSRKAAEERRNRRHSKPEHSLHYERGRGSNSDFSSVSSAYGCGHSVRGKYGEFFDWLHHNDDDTYHYRDRRGWTGSRSRSRSYESLWPSSSRSRSPTFSISPFKNPGKRVKRSNQGRSRSSSIECIAVVDVSSVDKKRNKKHKKHKKHKHKKSKTYIETIKSNSDIEVVDTNGDPDVLDLVTSGDNSGSKPTHSVDESESKVITDTEMAAGPSSQKSSEAQDSGRKYKKHPTGHKNSSFKPVKIKRNTELLKSLQNVLLPEKTTCDNAKNEICDNVANPNNDHSYNYATNVSDVSSSGQSVSVLDLSTSESSKNNLNDSFNEDARHPDKSRIEEALAEIDVVTCDDLQDGSSSVHGSEETDVENETEIDVENSDFEARILSDQEIDVVTCDNETKAKQLNEIDSDNLKSSSDNSFSDGELDVVSVEAKQDSYVSVNLDTKIDKNQMFAKDVNKQNPILLVSMATGTPDAPSEHSSFNGTDMPQTETVGSARNVNSIYSEKHHEVYGDSHSKNFISTEDIQQKQTHIVDLVSNDINSANCRRTKILADSEKMFSDDSNDKLQQCVAENQILSDKSHNQLQSVLEICEHDILNKDLKDEYISADDLNDVQSVTSVGDVDVQSSCASKFNDFDESKILQSVNLTGDLDTSVSNGLNDDKTGGARQDVDKIGDITDTIFSAPCYSTNEPEDSKQRQCAGSGSASSQNLSESIVECDLDDGDTDTSCRASRLISNAAVDSQKILPYNDFNSAEYIKDFSKQNISDSNLSSTMETINSGGVLESIDQINSELALSKDYFTNCSENSFDGSAHQIEKTHNGDNTHIGENEYSQTIDIGNSVKLERISTPDTCDTQPEHSVLVH